MTGAEYHACLDYRRVLELHRKVTRTRKWRVFAIACCRLVWHLLPEESRRLVDVTEKFHERQLCDKDREAARRTDLDFLHAHPAILAAHHCAEPTARIKTVARHDVPVKCVAAVSMEEGKTARTACIGRIAALVRDVFDDPFQSPHLDASWLTPSVRSLAEAACEHRVLPSGHLDLARLAVLSDALEEAGCTDADLLGHLRSPGPHVRGCWALDLLLVK